MEKRKKRGRKREPVIIEKVAIVKMRQISFKRSKMGVDILSVSRPEVLEIRTANYAVELAVGQEFRDTDLMWVLWDIEARASIRRWYKRWVKRILYRDGRLVDCATGEVVSEPI